MTARVYSEFCKGARILVPYIFLQVIGFMASIMLSEILAEYNYAQKNKVDDYLGFIFDYNRFSKMLNIDEDMIMKQLKYLQNLKFIEIYDIGLDDSFYLQVNDDNIINFKNEHEAKNFSNNWDDGLFASINPTHKKVDFSESTLKIKQYFDRNATNPQSISMLDYLFLEYWVSRYEKIDGNIFEVFSDMDDFIQDCATQYNSRYGIQKISNLFENAYFELKKQQDLLRDEIPPDFI